MMAILSVRMSWAFPLVALAACSAESISTPAPLPAAAPACAERCVGPSGATPDHIDCIREACEPAGDGSTAGVAWTGLGVETSDPSSRQDDLTTGESPTMAPVARFMVRAVETDALYASLVDAWFRCQSRVFHRAGADEDWQIRFYAPERDLLAMWSWREHRVVFYGVVKAGVDDDDRAVWTLPAELSPGDPRYLSPSEAQVMARDLAAVDVCGG